MRKAEQRFAIARSALLAFFGARPLPEDLASKMKPMESREAGNYRYWFTIRSERDGLPPKLDIGVVVISPDMRVLSVEITPEAEAKRSSS